MARPNKADCSLRGAQPQEGTLRGEGVSTLMLTEHDRILRVSGPDVKQSVMNCEVRLALSNTASQNRAE